MLQGWLIRGDSEVLQNPVSFYLVSPLFSLLWLLSHMVPSWLLQSRVAHGDKMISSSRSGATLLLSVLLTIETSSRSLSVDSLFCLIGQTTCVHANGEWNYQDWLDYSGSASGLEQEPLFIRKEERGNDSQMGGN